MLRMQLARHANSMYVLPLTEQISEEVEGDRADYDLVPAAYANF